MSEYIPFEIQQEIIKKLTDVPSLIRLRSVSKQYKSFIDSTDFIFSFCVPHTDPHRLIIRHNNPNEKYVLVTNSDDTDHTQQELLSPIVHEFNEILKDVRVVGSSHGLFCLHGSFRDTSYYRYYSRNEMVILQNPTIRKSIRITVPYSWYSNAYVGFAVCPITNDPTIVKISHENISWEALKNGYCKDWEVHVFTLSSRSWKAVTNNLPRCSINVSWSHVALDKFIYFSAFDKIAAADGVSQQLINLIVSFDTTTHEFKVIDFPDKLSHSFYMNVCKLWESLVVLEYKPSYVDKVCTIWMMEDDVTKSFTKLFAIHSPDAHLKTVIGFNNSGAPIMETHYNHEEYAKLEVYKPWTKQISDLGVHGEDESFCVTSYMETLLLLDHVDCCVYS